MTKWKTRPVNMRILGIDPGLKATGYGLIDVLDQRAARTGTRSPAVHVAGQQVILLEAGTIEPSPKGSLPDKLSKIYKNLDEIIVEFKPDVMILEKIYAHYKHPATASILGHTRGVICLLSAQRKIKLIEHSVKRIRTALVGNGAATKEQTKAVVAHILKLKSDQLPLDASDALALALGFAHLVRY